MKAMLVGCDRPLTTVFTERSGSSIEGPLAGALTVVWIVVELSFVSASGSVARTLAVFVNCPVACGVIVTFTIAIEPLAIEPRLQVIVGGPLHVPCVGIAETNAGPDTN
jgi:hypothetical protein